MQGSLMKLTQNMSCTKTADFQHVPDKIDYTYTFKDGVIIKKEESPIYLARCTECGLVIRCSIIKGEKIYYTLW
jgi:hypothetical protein